MRECLTGATQPSRTQYVWNLKIAGDEVQDSLTWYSSVVLLESGSRRPILLFTSFYRIIYRPQALELTFFLHLALIFMITHGT